MPEPGRAKHRDDMIETAAETLRRRLLNALHVGLVAPGDRLPSVRAVARELRVAPKVALVAYQILSDEKLVSVRSRSGVFVANRSAFVGGHDGPDWLVDALVQARRGGLTLPRAAEVVRQHLAPAGIRALVLDRNDDQLWSVRDELERDYGMSVAAIDLDTLDRPRRRMALNAELRRASLIVTTAFERRSVRMLTRHTRLPVCAVTMCTDLFSHVRAQLPRRPAYFVVADARLAARLRRMFASVAGKQNLRVLVYERDSLVIPAEALVYCTRLVRQRLNDAAPGSAHARDLLARTLTEAHVFSEETAEELTRFVVARGS
jgi:DNA-binding transcriptional regulator YhcF (GntR family)